MAPIVWVVATMTSMQCGLDVLCWRGVPDPKTGKVESFYSEFACVTAKRELCPEMVAKPLVCECKPQSEVRL